MRHHFWATPLPHALCDCLLLFAVVLAVASVPHAGAEGEAGGTGPDSETAGYLPGRLGLKFEARSAPAQALRQARTEGMALDQVSLSPELDALKTKYTVSATTPRYQDTRLLPPASEAFHDLLRESP